MTDLIVEVEGVCRIKDLRSGSRIYTLRERTEGEASVVSGP